MKKNKMMRVASFLLVAVLLSTSVISGTFAKYVTEDSATDAARVAKFGVEVKATGALFADTYKTTSNTPGAKSDSTAAATLSVVSSAVTGTTTDHDGVDATLANKRVAPGTQSTDDGLQIEVKGTPEVAVKLTVVLKDKDGTAITTKADADAKDVFLKAISANAGYADMTTGDEKDVFTLAQDYHPIKFTLAGGTDITPVTDGTLGDVVAELNKLNDKTYDANTNLADKVGTLKLTWKWDYSASDAVDKADTLLGDLAADSTIAAKTSDSTAETITWSALAENADFCLDTGLTIEITITQVD